MRRKISAHVRHLTHFARTTVKTLTQTGWQCFSVTSLPVFSIEPEIEGSVPTKAIVFVCQFFVISVTIAPMRPDELFIITL